MHLTDRSLAGAKCLKYSWLSDSVVVVAKEIVKVFRACEGGRGAGMCNWLLCLPN